jgi:hypothetical protein
MRRKYTRIHKVCRRTRIHYQLYDLDFHVLFYFCVVTEWNLYLAKKLELSRHHRVKESYQDVGEGLAYGEQRTSWSLGVSRLQIAGCCRLGSLSLERERKD